MGIREEVELVTREFVPGNILLMAVAQHEKVSLFQAARWLLRNLEELEAIPMLAFNREMNDFNIEDHGRASEMLFSVNACDETALEWIDCDYVAGWLSSNLKSFFSMSSLDYPDAEIEKLLLNNLPANALLVANKSVGRGSIDDPNASTKELTHWPWGNHHTELLGHLEAAALRYWVNYDPTDSTTAPTNKDVAEWLVFDRKVSQKMADAIASILRPDDLPTGPRK